MHLATPHSRNDTTRKQHWLDAFAISQTMCVEIRHLGGLYGLYIRRARGKQSEAEAGRLKRRQAEQFKMPEHVGPMAEEIKSK